MDKEKSKQAKGEKKKMSPHLNWLSAQHEARLHILRMRRAPCDLEDEGGATVDTLTTFNPLNYI